MASFTAKYAGVCDSCEEGFDAGERVMFVGDGVLIHVGCVDSALRVRRRPPVEETCSVCWLIKPCGCDDGRSA